MGKYASEFVKVLQSWVGLKEFNGSHKHIIDIYNSQKPLPVGYKLKYTDAWCAGTITAAAVKLGYTDIIPCECSCPRMIELAKKMGIWVEADDYVPVPGDIIMYDWNDSGNGDNRGGADHVGGVEKVVGNKITIIEGNYSNAVKRRTLAVNGKYIRGYITPKYDAETTAPVKPAQPVQPAKNAVAEDGEWGKKTTEASQKVLGTTVDGIISNQPASCMKYVPAALTSSWEFKTSKFGAGSELIKAIQKLVGATADGLCGIKTVKAMQEFLKKKKLYTGAIDGIMGQKTVIGWQKYINSKM